MFEFVCRLDPAYLEYVIKDIYSFAEKNGGISKKELLGRMAPHIKVHPGDDKIGWGYAQINNLESCATIEPVHLYTIFSLDDPVELVGNSSFDVVSNPAHYTEGRKYKPRKVIADWDLNFNLGNAVKYLARAGRKGDKIEDLRKAIQYIEFEIDECSKAYQKKNK